MRQVIDISTGEFSLARGQVVLRSLALGSCIALIVYDGKKQIGALAHIMLPGKSPECCTQPSRYAEDALDCLLDKMAQAGSDPVLVQSCLVGGGNVLRRPDDTICAANIRSVRRLLLRRGIPLRASVLGGTQRRNASLYIPEGRVTYTEANSPERLLWQFAPAGTESVSDAQGDSEA